MHKPPKVDSVVHKHLQSESYIYNTRQAERWWMVITVMFTKIIFSTKIKIAAQITMIFNAIVLN